MSNSIRSDSYSESVKRGLHPLTTPPIALHRRSATTENVNRISTYYPRMSNLSSSSRSATISASTEFILSFYVIETILFFLSSRYSRL